MNTHSKGERMTELMQHTTSASNGVPHTVSTDSIIEIPVDAVVYREDLYPRIKASPQQIQQYALDIENLPPIEVNQHNILIDGYHRWTAHKKIEAQTIRVRVTHTTSDVHILVLAIMRNASHGLGLNLEDKKDMAIRLYQSGTGLSKKEIAETLSVTLRSVERFLERTDKDLKEKRAKKIFELWMACHTQEEIAALMGMTRDQVRAETEELGKYDSLSKTPKSLAEYADENWTPPLYNVWKLKEKTNNISHFGNSEASFVDNLLYMFTQPFDIVVDPFAGGGSTIDVCKRRLRRYWVSDRKPIIERPEIRRFDITDGVPPLHKRWSDVGLLYLDPPYWKQAEGQYSNDLSDLANMPLEAFYLMLVSFIENCASKMRAGSHIALLIQPTQWRADDRCFPVDHIVDILMRVKSKRMRYQQRIICPYESQQYNAQQVEWAKANRQVLTLNRELVIWSVL